MYVRSLQIENLRCFQSAEIELQYPGRNPDRTILIPNVNLLLGINGSGKTTVLKAIVGSATSFITSPKNRLPRPASGRYGA